MSFRNRLTLFFVLIVIVPMISVAFVLFRLISDNESGKADAGVVARLEVVRNLYGDAVNRGDTVLRRIGTDPGLVSALTANRGSVLHRRAGRLASIYRARRLVLLRSGRVVIDLGDRAATAPAARDLVGGPGRGNLGQLEVSMTSAQDLVTSAKRVAGVDVVVRRGGRLLGASLPAPPNATLPRVGLTRLDGRSYRVASFDAPSFRGVTQRVSVLSDRSATSSAVGHSRLIAAAILAGFFVLAFAFATLVSRSLQQQIAGFLEAARRLGTGDFSAKVPVAGSDEFAALGQEFNKMSEQLANRLEELRDQRTRLESSLRRIGETFASNLDRQALLKIVLRTAVDGVSASAGRATSRVPSNGRLEPRVAFGDADSVGGLLGQVERQTVDAGRPQEVATGGGWALGHPLLAGDPLEDRAASSAVLGTVSVARTDRDFTPSERDLFHYLAAQAAISIENVDLHETVQRQAVTDELTGLFNHRRFQEVLVSEVERSKRFGHGMGLVMLDIDNFKRVNDTYGHQQGDLVLREVARVLRELSREIDSPARYGGEELAVVLPQTDIEGAYNFAERVRGVVEELELPLLEGVGRMSITASLGVAALPDSASEPRELIAKADTALYRAKRTGKNKTVQAQ